MTKTPILLGEASEGERRAATLDRLASELEREATALAGSLDGVLHAFTDAVWRGPAAASAHRELLAGQRRVRSAADELRAVTALLRRHAGDAKAQSADLRRRAALAATAPLRA